MKKFLLLLTVFALFGAAGAAELECFSQKGIAANFIDIKGKWKKNESRVEISQTSTGLRFTFFTFVKGKDYTFSSAAKPDTPAVVVGGEALEIQICPDPRTGVYFHIGVNPAGVLYTARKRDVSWNPRNLKVNVKDWGRVTMDVAYADLGVKKPAPGSTWKINFCHTRGKGNYYENFSWAGINDFHDYRKYGTLRFGSGRTVLPVIEEQSSVKVKARVINGAGCRLELIEDGRQWHGIFSNAGVWEFTPAQECELPIKSYVKRTFRLRDRHNKIIWERSALSGFDNRPCLELDRFYYTPSDKKIRWKSALPGKKSFFLSGPESRKWESSERAGTVAVPGKAGRYLLTVRSGKSRLSRVIIVTETTPLMRNCTGRWERKGDFLACGGKRRFLVGGSQTRVLQLHHGNCFNLGHIKVGKLPNALEITALKGKKLRRSPEGTGYAFPGDEKQTMAFFKNEALRLSKEPLQISRIAYEAQMKSWLRIRGKLVPQNSAELYKKIYDVMKKNAPGQLFSLQIDRQEQAPRFVPACDVFEVAVQGSYKDDPMPGIAEEIRNIRKTVQGRVLIHWFGVTVPNNYCRTAEELRAELFLSFINGGAGVLFHLGHGYLPAERSRLWSVISSTGAELDEMMEEFHSGSPVTVAAQKGFQTAVRDCGSYWLIVAVNCSNMSQRLKMTLPAKKFFSANFSGYEARVFRIRK